MNDRYYHKKEDIRLIVCCQLLYLPAQQDYCKDGSTNLKHKQYQQYLTLLTPIFRLTSMELTQIHDLIIQLFSLLKKGLTHGLDDGDASAETFFDWLIQMDGTP